MRRLEVEEDKGCEYEWPIAGDGWTIDSEFGGGIFSYRENNNSSFDEGTFSNPTRQRHLNLCRDTGKDSGREESKHPMYDQRKYIQTQRKWHQQRIFSS